ncbi:transcription initiation factor TFIIE subunit alpha [Nematocida major]|uniref:transcription initiation factor TFIIE subunit alpha n=1 Tax=Nematocida major TaxID=1912982 RepID=UPI0020085F41|nr:transcription initiation factor TFIIE subunit alpha [Nematocida major]KAH9386029.1 transcription initiation factor TFIIE subunit alpha [Nematocida major]
MDAVRVPMEELIKRVVRMFYEPCHAVIMDIMLAHLVLDEEDLADKMKLLPREFNRMAVRLRDDKLLSSETISDMKEDGRQETKTKFFLDFRGIRDVIKYKMYIMTQRLEKKMRNKESTLGLGCLACGVSYSMLDAQSFLCMEDFTFKCPECQGELAEKKESSFEEKDAISNTFSLMMEEISPVIRQLKEIDTLGIPEMMRGKIILPQRSAAPAKPYTEALVTEIQQEVEEKEQEAPMEIEITEEQGKKEEDLQASEDMMLEVEGVKKLFRDITEQDKERMSEAEYERYFELFESQQGDA